MDVVLPPRRLVGAEIRAVNLRICPMAQITSPVFPRPSNDRGFTLIELMVGLAIVMVMVSLALPPIADTIRSVRLESTASSLAADLGRARIEAMKRN